MTKIAIIAKKYAEFLWQSKCFMRLEKISEIDFRRLHNRGARGTGAGYKWDFKKDQMIEVKTREEVVALFYAKMGLDKRAIKKSLKSKP